MNSENPTEPTLLDPERDRIFDPEPEPTMEERMKHLPPGLREVFGAVDHLATHHILRGPEREHFAFTGVLGQPAIDKLLNQRFADKWVLDQTIQSPVGNICIFIMSREVKKDE